MDVLLFWFRQICGAIMNNFIPYKQAAEEEKQQAQLPRRALQTVAGAGLGLAAGKSILKRVTPFLNKLIPADLAAKGLSNADPRFGKFIQGALSKDFGIEEIRDFITNQIKPEEMAKQEQPQEQKNIIAKYSDKLLAFLQKEIQSGADPLLAGAKAVQNKEFQPIIKKMEADTKSNWSSILQSVFGATQQPQAQQQTQPMQQQNQAQGNSNADQAIMAALQKVLQM